MASPMSEHQRRFWEWHWDHWQERHTLNSWKDRRHERVLAFLTSLDLPRSGTRILDVGCGPGHYTRQLADYGETTGVDICQTAIATARGKYSGIRFIAADIYENPLPSGQFDVVVTQETFDHVPDQPLFLEVVHRLLTARGHLIVTCTNKVVTDRLSSAEFAPSPEGHVARYLDRRTFSRLLRARFDVLALDTVLAVGQHGFLRLTNSTKLNRALSLVVSPSSLEAAKCKLGLGLQMIALARKRG